MKQKIQSSLQKIVNNMKRKKNKTDKVKKTKSTDDSVETDEKIVDETIENTTEEVQEELTKEEQLEQDLEEAQNKHLRLMAEFQNFRQRASKMQLDQADRCASKTIKHFLPVVDDFDRAAQQEDFSEGVNLVHQKLNSTLEQLGVKPMESTGEDFNPDFHEAITKIPAPTPELKGKVVDTIEKGYYINDEILRFAKVVVGE